LIAEDQSLQTMAAVGDAATLRAVTELVFFQGCTMAYMASACLSTGTQRL
jgi:hypothetical protein